MIEMLKLKRTEADAAAENLDKKQTVIRERGQPCASPKSARNVLNVAAQAAAQEAKKLDTELEDYIGKAVRFIEEGSSNGSVASMDTTILSEELLDLHRAIDEAERMRSRLQGNIETVEEKTKRNGSQSFAGRSPRNSSSALADPQRASFKMLPQQQQQQQSPQRRERSSDCRPHTMPNDWLSTAHENESLDAGSVNTVNTAISKTPSRSSAECSYFVSRQLLDQIRNSQGPLAIEQSLPAVRESFTPGQRQIASPTAEKGRSNSDSVHGRGNNESQAAWGRSLHTEQHHGYSTGSGTYVSHWNERFAALLSLDGHSPENSPHLLKRSLAAIQQSRSVPIEVAFCALAEMNGSVSEAIGFLCDAQFVDDMKMVAHLMNDVIHKLLADTFPSSEWPQYRPRSAQSGGGKKKRSCTVTSRDDQSVHSKTVPMHSPIGDSTQRRRSPVHASLSQPMQGDIASLQSAKGKKNSKAEARVKRKKLEKQKRAMQKLASPDFRSIRSVDSLDVAIQRVMSEKEGQTLTSVASLVVQGPVVQVDAWAESSLKTSNHPVWTSETKKAAQLTTGMRVSGFTAVPTKSLGRAAQIKMMSSPQRLRNRSYFAK